MQSRAGSVVAGILVSIAACAAPLRSLESPPAQVLFVCEHGNVKSLMAASYFNQFAHRRGVGFRGVSRGLAPDSPTAPDYIIAGLRDDGVDVSAFRPTAVSPADVSASMRVVAIGTALPASASAVGGVTVEQWNDVPPASTHYEASRASLKAHVRQLIDELSRSGSE